MIGLADAWARMSFSFDPDGGWYEKAEALTNRALAAAPGLPEGHYLRGRLLWTPRRDFDHAGAMREFFAAIAASPSLGEAHHFLALLLLHIGMLDESQRAGEQALAIYPDDLATQHIGLVRLLQGRYEEGREISEEALARVSSTWTYYQLAQCQIRMGRSAQAALTTERAAREYPGHVLVLSLRGLLAAMAGEAGRAREHAAAVVGDKKSFGHYHHAEYDLACIHALLGEPRQADVLLRESARNGFPCLPFFEIDPFLEPARKTEDYTRLMSELSKDHESYRRLYDSLRSQAGT
jgi:tetratricopeptide (TPR) repeat protein